MPRPRKCRQVCHFPQALAFVPEESGGEKPPVILTVDEYEAIRLIDKEGLSQEQCCEFMQVARTTVQQIYASARKKLAEVLVDGLPLRIEGGDYRPRNGGYGHGRVRPRLPLQPPAACRGHGGSLLPPGQVLR